MLTAAVSVSHSLNVAVKRFTDVNRFAVIKRMWDTPTSCMLRHEHCTYSLW